MKLQATLLIDLGAKSRQHHTSWLHRHWVAAIKAFDDTQGRGSRRLWLLLAGCESDKGDQPRGCHICSHTQHFAMQQKAITFTMDKTLTLTIHTNLMKACPCLRTGNHIGHHN